MLIYIYIYIYIYICICIYLCVCVCEYFCVYVCIQAFHAGVLSTIEALARFYILAPHVSTYAMRA